MNGYGEINAQRELEVSVRKPFAGPFALERGGIDQNPAPLLFHVRGEGSQSNKNGQEQLAQPDCFKTAGQVGHLHPIGPTSVCADASALPAQKFLDRRLVVRCQFCGLRQFKTRSGNCRRCDKPLPLLSRKSFSVISSIGSNNPRHIRGNSVVGTGLGSQIRILRELRGLTQQQLAQATGSVKTNISALEHGRRGCGPRPMQRLAEVLGVPVSTLVERPTDPVSLEIYTLAATLSTSDLKILAATVRDLPRA